MVFLVVNGSARWAWFFSPANGCRLNTLGFSQLQWLRSGRFWAFSALSKLARTTWGVCPLVFWLARLNLVSSRSLAGPLPNHGFSSCGLARSNTLVFLRLPGSLNVFGVFSRLLARSQTLNSALAFIGSAHITWTLPSTSMAPLWI